MSEQKKTEARETNVVMVLMTIAFTLVKAFFLSCWQAASRKSTWSKTAIKIWTCVFIVVPIFAYAPGWDIPRIMDALPFIFPHALGGFIYRHITPNGQAILFTVLPFLCWLAFLGAIILVRNRKYQNALEHLSIKNPTGIKPKVVDVIELSQDQRKIVLFAPGFDVKDFLEKKVILGSALNQVVQDIRQSPKSLQLIEIRLSDKDLPTSIPFDDVSMQLSEPFSFVIGEGVHGLLISSLTKVHHMLVAGASGNGKSFFVKQLLVGLLQSSKHIQLYLLDLKRGVEMKVFEPLNNIVIAKNNAAAIETLAAVVREMNRRFDYLEKHGYTEIDCKRDKLDRIVVLVDEASELFTVIKNSKEEKTQAENAREFADKISKLGRVAGIHLVLATQKVSKETIDTRIQTNVNARMIFRVNTLASSMTVLGSGLAVDLPEIPGRGIWSVGSRDLLVQTAKLNNTEVAKEVAKLTDKFNGKDSPLYQSLLLINA